MTDKTPKEMLELAGQYANSLREALYDLDLRMPCDAKNYKLIAEVQSNIGAVISLMDAALGKRPANFDAAIAAADAYTVNLDDEGDGEIAVIEMVMDCDFEDFDDAPRPWGFDA